MSTEERKAIEIQDNLLRAADGDYGSPEHVTADEAAEAIKLAESFVSHVTALLKECQP